MSAAPDFFGKRLLIVEDEEDLREPLVENFGYLGFIVYSAANGVDGIKIVRSESIDVVVSDIRMPGGDGVALLKAIKQTNALCPATLLMTGYAEFSAEQAYQIGAEAVLAKPFDLDAIEDAVAQMLMPAQLKWSQRLAGPPPKYALHKTYASLSAAIAQGCIRLGRGGLYLRGKESLPRLGDALSIDLHFGAGELAHIRGVVRLRWSREDKTEPESRCCGVEFQSIEQPDIAPLRQAIEQAQVQPYIPDGLVV